MKKILVIAPQPFYEDRGTPIAVRQVLTVLSQSGKQVDLLTYPLGLDIELPGLRIFRPNNPFAIRHVPIGFSLKKILLDIFLTWSLWKLLRRNIYDCIHAVEEAALPATILGQRHHIPVIYDMQSSIPEQMTKFRICRTRVVSRILRLCERWLIRKVDYVACSSGLEELVRGIDPSVRLHGWRFPSEESHVSKEDIQNLRAKLGISPQCHVVLYCGNFESYQGVAMLIDALQHVVAKVPDTVLVLVGTNHDVKKLKRSKGIILVPRQPRTAIPLYLAMADVVVSPRENSSSNLPLKIFEYMAAGKPIVATDSLTHRRILNDDLAILVKPTANELAKAIVKILQDPLETKRLCNNTKAYARLNLSWADFTARVLEIYLQATNGRRVERSASMASILHADKQ